MRTNVPTGIGGAPAPTAAAMPTQVRSLPRSEACPQLLGTGLQLYATSSSRGSAAIYQEIRVRTKSNNAPTKSMQMRINQAISRQE